MIYFVNENFMIIPENIDSIFIAKNDNYVLCFQSKAGVTHSFTHVDLMKDDEVIESLELPEFIQYKTTITEKNENLKEGFKKLRQMYIKAFQI